MPRVVRCGATAFLYRKDPPLNIPKSWRHQNGMWSERKRSRVFVWDTADQGWKRASRGDWGHGSGRARYPPLALGTRCGGKKILVRVESRSGEKIFLLLRVENFFSARGDHEKVILSALLLLVFNYFLGGWEPAGVRRRRRKRSIDRASQLETPFFTKIYFIGFTWMTQFSFMSGFPVDSVVAFYIDGNSFLPWSSVAVFFFRKKFNMAPIAFLLEKSFSLARITALQSTHRWILKYRAKQK